MIKLPPTRISSTILNALKGGVVPRVGLEYVTVGRINEINAILNDINLIQEGGATFRFLVGKYGSGKSFLLQTIRNHAMEKNFVVIDADLSPERRLQGTKGQGLATYKELIKNMSTKTSPEGGALTLILQKWLSAIQTQVISQFGAKNQDEFNEEIKKKIYVVVNDLQCLVNGFDFAKAIILYWDAYRTNDDDKKAKVLKWFRGEYGTKKEAKDDLEISTIITDENWYDYIKLFSQFLVKAGYKGLLVLIDEMVNIFKIPNSITRQYNYEKILTLYNDVLQGKATHIGFIMGSTPQSLEDPRRGIFSYEALRSRLTEGKFANTGYVDLLSPIIRIEALTNEEMLVLIDKLADIHCNHFQYKKKVKHEDLVLFLKIELSRVGATSLITPREIIRDFVEVLNIIYQNPNKTMAEIVGADSFEFSKGLTSEEDIHKSFVDFEV